MTDRELLERIANGDSGAFDILYNRYKNLAGSWVSSRIGANTDLLPDILQESWSWVWLKPYSVCTNANSSARNFLLHYLSYRVLDLFRRIADPLVVNNDDIVGKSADILSYNHVQEDSDVRELQEMIHGIIDGMPALAQEIFRLRCIEGRSVTETAETLSVTEKTVRNRLSLTLASLREELTLRYETGDAVKLTALLPLIIELMDK
jgi:RNA polymerase sigma factor (sigma-70 family)